MVGGLSRTQNTPTITRKYLRRPPTSSERHFRRPRSTERTVHTIRGGHAADSPPRPGSSERHAHPLGRGERYVHTITEKRARLVSRRSISTPTCHGTRRAWLGSEEVPRVIGPTSPVHA